MSGRAGSGDVRGSADGGAAPDAPGSGEPGGRLSALSRVLRPPAGRPFRGKARDRAAVVLLVRRRPPLEVLYIRRARFEEDPWSGHSALPGGRASPADPDLLAAARRETREELGLVLEEDHFLGRLSDVAPGNEALPIDSITPFVARPAAPARIVTNQEVESWAWVPVTALREPGRRGRLVLGRGGERREFPTIECAGHTIWGITYRITRRFLERVDEAGIV